MEVKIIKKKMNNDSNKLKKNNKRKQKINHI